MDTKVVDINVNSSVSKIEAEHNQSVENYQNNYSDSINGNLKFDITFIRLDNQGRRFSLPLNRESLGIQLLFQIAGRLLSSIDKGRTVLIDETNANLHPLINKEIISMVTDSSGSSRHSQLIFTTYDVSVSEHESLSRNQIWMIAKKEDLSLDLYAFSDFNLPKENSFQRGYLFGRYGGTPRIVKRNPK